MKAIQELYGTELYASIINCLTDLAKRREDLLTAAARSESLEDIRYKAGVADGIRVAISALSPKENDAQGS